MTFLKRTPHASEEARGLAALAEFVRVPRVVAHDASSITLDHVDIEPATPAYWSALGEALARLHRFRAPSFGFEIDNHIGATTQSNPLRGGSWGEWFHEHRLRPMFERVGHPELLARVPLAETEEAPTLVHGDLWAGNVLCGRGQEPVFIDPAPYWGHREVDLAMTELFGGFSPEFYSAYARAYPLSPGYSLRKRIYNLYHLVNHWILFGSAYRDQTYALLGSF